MSYQYFITVVPTYVNTYSYRGSTFQYSVSEQAREIAHDKVGGLMQHPDVYIHMYRMHYLAHNKAI